MNQNQKRVFVVLAAVAALSLASAAGAQNAPVMDYRWSFDIGLGFESTISGNINSGAIGTLNNQATVILPNSYDEVYGTGFHLKIGAGYLVDEITEVRGVFTYQSIQPDLTPMGDFGVSRLYGEYDPYRSYALDVGLRRYFDVASEMRLYTEGTAGIGFISEIDVMLSAPGANLNAYATDFYDRTAAIALGGHVGLLWQASNRVGLFGQAGLRWTSGLAQIDDLSGGLETINDGSSRWTVPFVVGLRARF